MTIAMNNPAASFLRLLAAIVAIALALSAAPAIAAVKVQEVVSPGGVKAWLVEDYTVPIVAMRFAFESGSVQDPTGKQGIASLMTGLFDEGAGDIESADFQARLDRNGVSLRFDADRDVIYGSMRVLQDDAPAGFDLLRLAITQPRFDQNPVDRIRAQLTARLVSESRNPQRQAQEQFRAALYGDHPYARSGDGTVDTLAAITREDLAAFHRKTFARDNLHVAVVGAIDPERLKTVLDEVFGGLPEKAELTEIARVEPRLGQTLRLDYDLATTSIQLVYPGVERSDDRFFAAFIMNHILGGGTFSSRLFDEVREKRGLVYGVGSGLSSLRRANTLSIGTSTRPERAGETLSVIKETVALMAAEGPTEEELARAKTYLVGAYPINNLDSSNAIARTLVELQLEDLGIDYIDRRASLIEAVTLDEVKAEAARLLSGEPAVMIVGKPQENGG